MTREKQPRYPWGTETPGPRLRATCAKARTGFDQVDTPGFHDITERVGAAVQTLRPLVDAMEFVARAGLRAGARDDDTVPGARVLDAVREVREVREALVALNASTAPTLSARYEALVAAVETLTGLADTAVQHGIAGTGGSDPNDPWQPFGA